MFDWDGVNIALASDNLSEGLFRLEQFTRSQGNKELADWARVELEGYDPEDWLDFDMPEYRKVIWLESEYIISPNNTKTFKFHDKKNSDHIRIGVAKLEYHQIVGFKSDYEHESIINGEEYTQGYISNVPSVTIKTVLASIRRLARRKFLEAFPLKPVSQIPILANSPRSGELDSTQRQYLHDALLDAFRDWGALQQMVSFGLDQNLAKLARSTNLSDAVFDLIQWAESQNRVKDLIEAAVKSNPQHKVLLAIQAFYQK